MEKTIGFIGVGNMGTAILKGILKAKTLAPEKISFHDHAVEKAQALALDTGAAYMPSNSAVVQASDIIILAVKPQMVAEVLEECAGAFDENKILVSIVLGVPISYYKHILGADRKIVRTMPNTPAMVGAGMTLIAPDPLVNGEELGFIRVLFESVGKVELLDEKLMCEVTALTGSSPAYVFMFIEAMADAAVLSGIPRDKAYRLASQAILGSARMVLETGKHPGELKDQVCSPAGSTIEAVSALEKNGFRYAVMEAMDQCTAKAREIAERFK